MQVHEAGRRVNVSRVNCRNEIHDLAYLRVESSKLTF